MRRDRRTAPDGLSIGPVAPASPFFLTLCVSGFSIPRHVPCQHDMTLRGGVPRRFVASSLHLIVNPARPGYDAFRIVVTAQLCDMFYRSGLGDMVRLPSPGCVVRRHPSLYVCTGRCCVARISWAQARLTHKLFPRSLPRSLNAASVGRNPRSISVS